MWCSCACVREAWLCWAQVYIAAFSLGMGAVPWIIMSEIFPVHVRGLAGSVATLVNWTASFTVTQTFQSLLLWSAPGEALRAAASLGLPRCPLCTACRAPPR